MSPDYVDEEETADPGPATVEHILDDLREAGIAVTTDPTHDSSHAAAGELRNRVRVPHTDVEIDTDRHDALELDAWVSGWVTPQYGDDDSAVAVSIGGKGADDTFTSTTAEMEPDEARDLALQLLASAAVVDDDRDDGLPGYSAE